MAAARRKVEHGAVLANHGVETADVSGNPAKVVEPPAGHQDDGDSLPARRANRVTHGRVEDSIDGDGAVVVERDDGEFHGGCLRTCEPVRPIAEAHRRHAPDEAPIQTAAGHSGFRCNTPARRGGPRFFT
jgi:hypothetical protein